MDIKELRRLDLIDLRRRVGWHGSLKKIEEKTGIDSTYIGRLCYEKNKPESRNIGDSIVEKLDKAFPGWRKRELEKLGQIHASGIAIEIEQNVVREPHGGMDSALVSIDGYDRQSNLQIRSVPVLTHKEIIEDEKVARENQKQIPAQNVSSSAFALSVNEIPNPNDRYGIDQDMIIVIDPDADWVNGKPLLIKDSNSNLIIRRYETVGAKRYLASFNEKYDPIEMDDSFIVIGRIVSRHAVY